MAKTFIISYIHAKILVAYAFHIFKSLLNFRKAATQNKEIHFPADIIKGIAKGLREEVGTLFTHQDSDKNNQGFIDIKIKSVTQQFLILQFPRIHIFNGI